MSEGRIPKHVAIIMDGNGRWAKKRFRPRWFGHRSGGDAVKEVVKAAAGADVKVLTLFAFGADNWRRPEKEVSFLMDLFHQHLSRETKQLHEHQIQIRFIGDRLGFSEKLQGKIKESEDLTKTNTGMVLVVAANYSGQWDLTTAARSLCEQVAAGKLAPENVTADQLALHLSSADLPYPDLFIRTSGEQRISNFYLWQLAYSELYFTDVLWPDFSKDNFNDALAWYAGRERRFGYTPEQLKEAEDA